MFLFADITKCLYTVSLPYPWVLSPHIQPRIKIFIQGWLNLQMWNPQIWRADYKLYYAILYERLWASSDRGHLEPTPHRYWGPRVFIPPSSLHKKWLFRYLEKSALLFSLNDMSWRSLHTDLLGLFCSFYWLHGIVYRFGISSVTTHWGLCVYTQTGIRRLCSALSFLSFCLLSLLCFSLVFWTFFGFLLVFLIEAIYFLPWWGPCAF